MEGGKVGLQWHRKPTQSYSVVICNLVTHRLRLEKSLVNTERMGVRAIENEWDFDR